MKSAAKLATADIQFLISGRNGAAYVTRTRDPVITNDVLYQLS